MSEKLTKEKHAIENLIQHRIMQRIMATQTYITYDKCKLKWSDKRVSWKEILADRTNVLQYDLSHRRNLIRVVDNLVGMAKCFHGLQYSRTAEDLITATNQIIDKLD